MAPASPAERHEVAVLALPETMAYEVGLPHQFLGSAVGRRRPSAVPGAGGQPGRRPGAHLGRLLTAPGARRLDPRRGPDRRGPRDLRNVRDDRRNRARRARRPAAADGRARPRGLHLHRRVRAGRRGSARRAPGDHALGAQRRLRPALPARPPGPRRAVRGRRRRPDLRGERRRHRPPPPRDPPRPRQRGGQPGRPPQRRGAVAGRRPVAVHRAAGARARRLGDGGHPRLGAAAARRSPDPRRPRRPRADERPHLHPPLPGGDGDVGHAMAGAAARRARPATAGRHGHPGRAGGGRGRVRHHGVACASTCTPPSASPRWPTGAAIEDRSLTRCDG